MQQKIEYEKNVILRQRQVSGRKISLQLGMRVDPDEEHPDGYSRKAWERYIVDNPDEHI